MSEIAGARSNNLAQSKPAISECMKAKLSDKPEIGFANFSVHAQKHAPHFIAGSVFDSPQYSEKLTKKVKLNNSVIS